MKKIIHLSDLHVGFADMEKHFHILIRNIIFKKQPAENYVIIITGDLIEMAKIEFFALAKKGIDTLRQQGFTVLAVPGNHDYSNLLYGEKKNIERSRSLSVPV